MAALKDKVFFCGVCCSELTDPDRSSFTECGHLLCSPCYKTPNMCPVCNQASQILSISQVEKIPSCGVLFQSVPAMLKQATATLQFQMQQFQIIRTKQNEKIQHLENKTAVLEQSHAAKCSELRLCKQQLAETGRSVAPSPSHGSYPNLSQGEKARFNDSSGRRVQGSVTRKSCLSCSEK
mmetsp:Transcript_88109/g.128787  ORF Transcript_88109/g.128787 Transcript_88109/m.128787 type:complete len:180 (-) Transcript_88109:940-1479(-)